MRRFLPVLCVLACRPEGVSSVDSAFQATPAAVAFPRTVVGGTATASVVLHNTSPGPLTLTLDVSAPFAVDASSVQFGGGAAWGLIARFAPTQAGAASAVLRISGPGGEVDVAFSGEGVEPSCAVPGPCQTTSIAQDGTCTLAALPDGTSCPSSCIDSAVCASGACVGTARDCSDGNVCTVDSCSEAGGCAHVPVACPKPDDPCRVATCDASAGCGSAPAPDGTACGPVDCTTSYVCISGACHAEATPEGGECAPATPCQGASTCHSNVCVAPPATPLVPEWSVTVGHLEFTGVADASGNVYALECDSACELVSRSPDGLERFRAPASNYRGLRMNDGFILAGSAVVIADPKGDGVDAYDATDGHLLWQRHMKDEVARQFSAEDCPPPVVISVITGPLISDGAGQLGVGVGGWFPGPYCGRQAYGTWVFQLDPATGATRSSVTWSPPVVVPFSAGLDEQDNLYVASAGVDLTLASWTQSGALRWQTNAPPHSSPGFGGVSGGTLVVYGWNGQIAAVDSAAGSLLGNSQPFNVTEAGFTAPGRATVFGLDGQRNVEMLEADFSVGDGSFSTRPVTKPSADRVNAIGGGVLTSRQTWLTELFDWNGATLDELGLDGRARFSCELPVPGYDTVLTGGHWVQGNETVWSSYAVPGLAPAAQGWITRRGNLAQSGHPQ
jgi:hypothetical protein